MSRRKMVLVALVAAMLVVIVIGYCMHQNSAVSSGGADKANSGPGGPVSSGPVSGSNY
jgi:hypothetical protein